MMMHAQDVATIIAATVPLIAAVVGGAVAIINALKGHGATVASNTQAVIANTAVQAQQGAPVQH